MDDKENTPTPPAAPTSTGPGGIVLASLILVAAVANLNLSVANVALPSIGKAFDASQVELNLVAVGFSLGLAASVLWFGALGDRHGRKMMLIIGTLLAIPASLLAAYAPTVDVLFVGSQILAINFAPVHSRGAIVFGFAIIAVAAGVAFFIRQRRAKNPLYDLRVAGRRTFWVAACAGIIVFGSLMGAMFLGQQFIQNVLGRTSICQARRSERFQVYASHRLLLLPARLPDNASALEGGYPLLEGRPCLRPRWNRRRVSGHDSVAIANRIRTSQARRHGVGDGRPAA